MRQQNRTFWHSWQSGRLLLCRYNLMSLGWYAHYAAPPLFLKSHLHAILAMVVCGSCCGLLKYRRPSLFPLVCNRCILYSSGLFHCLYAGPVGKSCTGVSDCWSGVCTSSVCAPGDECCIPLHLHMPHVL